jgi:hypothetical protein
VNDLLPAEGLLGVLQVLDGGEVVLVLLHGGDPGHVVERDDLEAEILVVADFLDFAEEGSKVGGGDIVDMG